MSKAIINLNNVEKNAKKIKKIIGNSRFCAVVKSNAYGHGLNEVATCINKYVDYFACGDISEGVSLRLFVTDKPILCLACDNDYLRASYYDIEVCISSVTQFIDYVNFCANNKIKSSFFVSVNTGMNRLGIDSVAHLDKMLSITKKCENISFKGVFSHFYNSKNQECNVKQFNAFLPYQKRAKMFDKNCICHIASSGNVIVNNDYNLDMVRIGLLLYGYTPFKSKYIFKKAMKIEGEILRQRSIKKGESLLYGDFKIKKDTNVKICKYGYADGYRIGLKNQLNASCMNMCAIKGNGNIIFDNANEVAKKNDTICYEVLVNIGKNLPKEYIKD